MKEPRRLIPDWLLAGMIVAVLVVGWVFRDPIGHFAQSQTGLVFMPETTVVAGGLKR